MKLDLTKTTFIIPLSIESIDREINTRITLLYLSKYLNTNIIILEHDIRPKVGRIIRELKLDNIKYMYCDNEGVFHRTQYLNMMLSEVKTPVVVNYDIDILLDPSVYLKCQNMILGGHDLVYPYSFGESQKQIKYSGRDKLISNLDIEDLSDDDIFLTLSKYGHCQFFNTESYIGGGMENEGFISYGPEDIERAYRFEKLGYKVVWNNNFIYHIEHSRGFNSSTKNPYFEANEELYEYIKSLSDSELCKYYNEIDYLKKYRP